MTDVVEIAKDILADEGIDVEVVEMGDYIQPNEALANEEIDATFSQHVPFMEQFNENTGERSEEHTSELQSRGHLVCRLLLEKKNHEPYSRGGAKHAHS